MEEAFYLKGGGSNVISQQVLDQFRHQNPELGSYLDNYPVYLKLLQIQPFESFCYWILSQQISGKAAETVVKRFKVLLPEIIPENLLHLETATLQTIGISRSKVGYLRNIAHYFQAQPEVESSRSSPELVQTYSRAIKGVGPWTVNMHLIFVEGRLDILATKDLAMRKGVQLMYKLKNPLKAQEIPDICKPWLPYATIGTLLAWNVAES